ncbi:MAG: DUF2605 domain-containing protein [Cyanobacteria bacterium P01_H01_bin.121]
MHPPALPDPELLKVILEPLLEDFRYWLERSHSFLEIETVSFLTAADQTQLADRVSDALREVESAKALFKATGGQVGVDFAVVQRWHQLVLECWRVSGRWRREQQDSQLEAS